LLRNSRDQQPLPRRGCSLIRGRLPITPIQVPASFGARSRRR
jgi:hypothetical protein